MFYDPHPPPPPAAVAPADPGLKTHRRHKPPRPSDTPAPTVPVPPPAVVAPELRPTLPPGLPANFRDLPAVEQWYLVRQAERRKPAPVLSPQATSDPYVARPLPDLPSYDPPVPPPFSSPGSPVPVSPPVPAPSSPGPAWYRLSNEPGVEGFGVLRGGAVHDITARRYLPGYGPAAVTAPVPAAACGPRDCPSPAARRVFPFRRGR